MWQLGLRYDTRDLNDGSFTAPVHGHRRARWRGKQLDRRRELVLALQLQVLALNYVKVSSERYSSSKKLFVQDDPSIVELRAQFYW